MKIVDRLFIRLLTRLTLSRATRHSDLAADLAAAHGADLAGVLADIDRLRRLLEIRVERVRAFVDDYSTDVPNLAQAEHLTMSLEEAAHEWSTVRLKGISGRYDRMVDADNEIASLKNQLDAADKTINRLCDDAARASAGSNTSEVDRYHAWALKLSGLPSKNNPSHEAVRTTTSRNYELMLTAHNELTAKSAEQAKKLKQWEHGSEQLQERLNAMTLDLETAKADLRRAQNNADGNADGWRDAATGWRTAVQQIAQALGLASGHGVKIDDAPQDWADQICAHLHADKTEAANVRSLCAKYKRIVERTGAGAPLETQRTISGWAADTFGPCLMERAAGRAVEEMTEFVAVLGFEGMIIETPLRHPSEIGSIAPIQYAQLMKEAADVVVCLYRVADLLGADLHEEIDRVMKINRGRQWMRDGKGCGYHVKSPTTGLPSIREQVPGAALYRYGDVAQALGKTTQEMVDAVAEATAGPFERVRDVAGHHHAAGDGPCDTEGCERFTPRIEPSEVAPAFFDDETETLPASELAELRQRLENAERREGRLRDGLERVLRAMFGAEVAARAVGDIGTDSFEAIMQQVREVVEHAALGKTYAKPKT